MDRSYPPSPIQKALQKPGTAAALLDRVEKGPKREINGLFRQVFGAALHAPEDVCVSVVKRMIDTRSGWINRFNEQSQTPLMEAVAARRSDLVKILLAAGARTSPKDAEGFNVLEIAARQNEMFLQEQEVEDALLENGTFTQPQKDRALYQAAHCGNASVVRKLLSHGATCGFRGQVGTALAAAALHADNEEGSAWMDIMRDLLATKAGLASIDKGWHDICLARNFGSPLHAAAVNGNIDALSTLLAHGASVNPPPGHALPGKPETPLMSATSPRHIKAMEILINAGADATLVDDQGQNVLHYLADSDSYMDSSYENSSLLKALKLLISAGADPAHEDRQEITPIEIARKNERHELAAAMEAVVSARDMAVSTNQVDPVRPRQVPRL